MPNSRRLRFNRHLILASFAALAVMGTIAVMPTEQVIAKKSAGHSPFTMTAFKAAQAAGKPILIDVYAPWCPTCRKQQPGVQAAQSLSANKNLVVFRMDFDKQKSLFSQFRVTRQSTLIAYKGRKETGRLIGATNAAKIADLVATTR